MEDLEFLASLPLVIAFASNFLQQLSVIFYVSIFVLDNKTRQF